MPYGHARRKRVNEDDSTDMCNVMFSHSSFPLVNIATHITENTATCLDHIWYNRSNIIASGAFIADISDHYPIFTALNISKNNRPVKKIIRDLSEANISSFLNAMPLFVQEYEQLCVDRDIDFQAQTLIEKIKELFDKHCPMKSKTFSYKSFIKPWLSRELVNSINYKHLLFKKYKLGINNSLRGL